MDTMTQNWQWFALAFVVAGYVLLRLRHQARGDADPGQGLHHNVRGGDGGRDTQFSHPSRSPDSVIDPVTGRPVCTAIAPAFFHQGRVYFFESVGNRERFMAAPGVYLRRGTVGRRHAVLKIDRPQHFRMVRASAGSLKNATTDKRGANRPELPSGGSANRSGARDDE